MFLLDNNCLIIISKDLKSWIHMFLKCHLHIKRGDNRRIITKIKYFGFHLIIKVVNLTWDVISQATRFDFYCDRVLNQWIKLLFVNFCISQKRRLSGQVAYTELSGRNTSKGVFCPESSVFGACPESRLI